MARAQNIRSDSFQDSSIFTVHTVQTRQSVRDNEEAVIVIPPDGGWGWVVVTASFLCNFVADGTIYTFAIFMYDISATFQTHYTNIAIANSVLTGFYYITGPINCALVNRFGFRVVGFLGGVLAAIAFISSTLIPSATLFLVIYGILGGMGFCMIYAPSIIALGFYFERWRALAISIAVCGTSLGMLSFPIIMEGCFSNYTWQGKFRILAGASLFCSLLALLYRPLQPVKIPKEEKKVQFVDDSSSIGSFHIAPSVGIFPKLFRRFHNTSYPTATEATSSSFITRSDSSLSMFVSSVPGGSISTFVRSSRLDDRSEKLSRIIEDAQNENKGCFEWCKRCCPKKTKKAESHVESSTRAVYIKPTFSAITERSERLSFMSGSEKNKCARFWRYLKRICKCPKCCSKFPRSISVNRPLYRDDIFFTGSLFTLPEYSRTFAPSSSRVKSAVDYHLSVTRVMTERDVLEEQQFCKCCPEAVKRTLATMLDLSLLRSPSFLLLAISGFLTMFGMFTPFIYITSGAQARGVPKETAIYLLSALGASNCVGRIASGVVSSMPNANNLVISYVSLLICGFSTIFSVFIYGVYWYFAYAIVYGLSLACLAALKTCIVVEMVGLKQLTNAFGLLMLFQAGACFMGVPLNGVVENLTNSTDYCFVLSGLTIVLSGALLVPIKRVTSWEKLRKANNPNSSDNK